MSDFFGAIEAGGTKFVCAIGDNNGRILKHTKIHTTTPEETMPQVVDFFESLKEKHPLKALGCGSFGPIDPNKNSSSYGYITHTPKLAWKNYNIVKTLEDQLNIPVALILMSMLLL